MFNGMMEHMKQHQHRKDELYIMLLLIITYFISKNFLLEIRNIKPHIYFDHIHCCAQKIHF